MTILYKGDLAVFHSDMSSAGVRITNDLGAARYLFVYLSSAVNTGEMPCAAPRGRDRLDPWDGTPEQLRALRRAWLSRNPPARPAKKPTKCQQLAKLQDLIGIAQANHGNDRDPHGFEKGQKALAEAFDIVVDMREKCPAV